MCMRDDAMQGVGLSDPEIFFFVYFEQSCRWAWE
jgi:hypothetical protein